MRRDDEILRLSRGRCTRRTMLRGVAGAAAVGAVWPLAGTGLAADAKRRIKQSVCLWCYDDYLRRTKTSLDRFAAACAKMGLRSIELTTPDLWPTLKKHGLICAMCGQPRHPAGLEPRGISRRVSGGARKGIDDTAAAGFPNVVTFSGNRDGMDDQEGLTNCIAGLKKVAGYAEKKKVTVCLEFLNSVHDHHDYMADSTKWCVGLVHGVGSPRVKVLYDIYHAGMMKEDILADIKEHHDCWGHFHTGGVPGRNEIDETQTLDYAKIMKAIADSGFQGYVAQEFVPKRTDALKSLEQAVAICDV